MKSFPFRMRISLWRNFSPQNQLTNISEIEIKIKINKIDGVFMIPTTSFFHFNLFLFKYKKKT